MEQHDNTKPAANGTISISRIGVMSYFPIEQAGRLKPFLALFVHEKPDGSMMCSIDTRWISELGEMDE